MIVLNGGYSRYIETSNEIHIMTVYGIVCCYITPKNILEPEFVHIFNIEELQQYGYYHALNSAPISHKRWIKYFDLH